MNGLVAAVALALVTTPASATSSAHRMRVVAARHNVMVDQPFRVVVTGVAPGESVDVELTLERG